LSLAFYPYYLGFVAWFALIRPLMIISRLRGREAFNASYFFGFFFNAFSLYWVAQVTPPGTFAAVAIVALYYAIALTVFNRLYHWRPLWGMAAVPFLWTGMEYFRTLSEFAFPWSDLGYTQSYYLYILQIVSVLSVHGLTLLIVTVNVLLWQCFRKSLSAERRLTSGFLSVAVVLLLIAYGWVTMPRFPLPGSEPVVVLQGSVPIEVKWKEGNEQLSFDRYDSLAQVAADTVQQLFVWPETSAPAYLSHHSFYRDQVRKTARASNGYHLIGAMGAGYRNSEQRYYNSCYQVTPEGVIDTRYDKIKLVPFTEQVPYQDHLPFLKKSFLQEYLTFIETYDVNWWSDFYPGDSIVLFETPNYHYGVLICFETTLPEYVRQMIRKGAGIIVGITNDTWFKRSVGIHMHSRIFITRAVENRCWMVRSANTGLSFIVDKYGRIREELDLYEIAALKSSANLLESYSVFTRYGDLAGLVSFLILLLAVVILIARWMYGKLTPIRDS
jgi:apolipoprotein N-acyltransferase